MAVASGPNELEDLVTCPICFSEFDSVDENKKPKFLPCSHTLCLHCIKGIFQMENNLSVTCPICRKVSNIPGDVNHLPNNIYALFILGTRAKKHIDDSMQENKRVPNWCFTCGSIAGFECLSYHSTMNMTSSTLSNFEALLALKEDYLKMKEPVQLKLEAIVHRMKEFSFYLAQVLDALKSFESNMKTLQENNDVMLAEAMSLLESDLFASGSKEKENDAFLAELLSLVDSSHPEEKLESLKTKMKESFSNLEQKFSSHDQEIDQSELVAKTRVVIQLFDEHNASQTTSSILDGGFIAQWKESLCEGDLLLLSHLVIAVAKQADRNSAPAPTLHPLPPPQPFLLPALAPSENNQTVTPSEYTFVVTVKQLGVVKGQIHISPTLGPTQVFTEQFGQYCYRSPKVFHQPLKKTIADAIVNLPFAFDDFKPISIPGAFASQPFDVGLLKKVETSPTQQLVIGWDLVFLLEHFERFRSTLSSNPKYAPVASLLKSAILFGRVTEGYEILAALSRTRPPNNAIYSFTIESR